MSNPSGALPNSGEPQVEIRQNLASINAPTGGYGAVIVDPPSEGFDPSVHSVNSTSAPNGTTTRTRTDKAPLLHGDLVRSLSGMGGGMETTIKRDGLSTFSGVFCPVCLSMFSVLLFLRMGYVVGYAGILLTLTQLVLAYGIIILTVLSLCAVSTNGAIEGGGVYYMISRALGPEFGGSIGVLFFLANVFGNALYISGFVETLLGNLGPGGYTAADVLPDTRWYRFLYGFAVSIIVLLICLVGAALFAKTSLIVLFVVAVSYISFVISLIGQQKEFKVLIPKDNEKIYGDNQTVIDLEGNQYFNYTGIREKTFQDNLYQNFTTDYTTEKSTGFFIVFGVVFSGVTGIMAGANMSGELKEPNVSIPRGTLQAVGFTFIVYILSTFLIGASCQRMLLQNNYVVLQEINYWSGFIIIGIFCTTLFAGLSNLIGASRVLTRVGEDRLFGKLLQPTTIMFRGNNPVISVLVSWFLSLCVLLIGALNQIAQITSIFFLLSYVGVNLACLALELASAPNFRPTFRYFSSYTAFLGAVGCIVMMFLINAAMSGIAITLLILLLLGLHYKAPIASWGSISQALIFHQVRKYLLLLDSRKDHVKYWRPQMLLLVKTPSTSCPLIDFVNDIKKSGLYVIGHVNQGTLNEYPMDPLHEDMPYWMSLIDYLRIKAFVELTISSSVREGIQQLMRISGLGAMKPNTIVLGFLDSTKPENTLEQGKLMRDLKHAKLDRAEVVEYFTARDVSAEAVPGHSKVQESRMTVQDYVAVVQDALKMHKNIILARHFHRLDKELIFKISARKYVDVWPVDLARPHNSGQYGWDNSALFLLQLACILSMVPGWKHHTTLRVYLCVTSLNDMSRKERQLKKMLGELRISAKSVVVPWDHVVCHVPAEHVGDAWDSSGADAYVNAFNEMIKRTTDQTAVVFINMPPPPNPRPGTPGTSKGSEDYLDFLDKLTNDLPPTLLVHGLSSVISTAL